MKSPEAGVPLLKGGNGTKENSNQPCSNQYQDTLPWTSSSLPSASYANSADWKLLHGRQKVAIEGKGGGDNSLEKGLKVGKTGVDDDEDDDDVLDKGFAWVIVAGGFLSQFLIGGLMRCDGIFFLQFEQRFNQSKQLTAWPSAISFTLQCFIAPVATAFCNRFSVRTSVHLGTLLLVSGWIITAFAPNIYLLFLSYSILLGVGRGMIMAPGIYIVNMYFNKRLGMAQGFASAGTGIGTLGMPPLIEWLFERMGYQKAILIIAGISGIGWVIAMLFRPLSMHREMHQEKKLRDCITYKGPKGGKPIHEKTFYSWYGSMGSTLTDAEKQKGEASTKPHPDENTDQSVSRVSETAEGSKAEIDLSRVVMEIDIVQKKRKKNCCVRLLEVIFPVEGVKRGKKNRPLFHWPLFRDFPFLVLCVSMAFFNLAQKTVFTFLPAIAEEEGVYQFSLVLSIAGAGDTIGRIAAGFLMDRPKMRPFRGILYSLVLVLAAGAAIMVPFCRTLLLFCVAGGIYGAMVGASVSQKSTVLAALMGKETVNSAFGILYSFQGIGTLAGPPLSGAMKDILGDYSYSFYLSSGSMFSAGALVALSVLLFALRKLRRERKATQEYEPLATAEEPTAAPPVPEVSTTFTEQREATGSNVNPNNTTLR